MFKDSDERSACGVGFVVNRKGLVTHDLLLEALAALASVEHRGACGADGITGDGAGIMADIPFELFGYERGTVAIATLFLPNKPERCRLALKVFEETFRWTGFRILDYREVPTDDTVLGSEGRESRPIIKHAIIERPSHCRTDESFNKLLYLAKQYTRTKQRGSGVIGEFFFTSLSTTTIVYKGLTRAQDLPLFYKDLVDPRFKTRFALFHRRFSTNTKTSWDKAQPFRLVAHNGEINTIQGNRAWAIARERALGLPMDELLTHKGISDSGSLNEMVEALKYRSSIPRVEDILAIMMPPADQQNSYYRFWSRAMEPWDGPAFIAYSDGETIGARLDRNGFRPCRWKMTDEHFYLCSEAGAFVVDESKVVRKGALSAGRGVTIDIKSGRVKFEDPSISVAHRDVTFEPRLRHLIPLTDISPATLDNSRLHLFRYTQEDIEKILLPMVAEGKESIGSMGDTARLAVFSAEPRSFFDYFYHDFAQVTNPPLDFLRERMVTDLVTHVGRRPNIFAPKELIPPPVAVELATPVLTLSEMRWFEHQQRDRELDPLLSVVELSTTFNGSHGVVGLKSALERLAREAVRAATEGATLLILSDREASYTELPIPSLLALRAVSNALHREGVSLLSSIIVHSGEIRSTHHVAALIASGATAVCPYLALTLARMSTSAALAGVSLEAREENLQKALSIGLLKIMSKMGISVVRSYQGSKLLTAIGVGSDIIEGYFPELASPIGGIGFDALAEDIISQCHAAELRGEGKMLHTYQYKEHTKGGVGEGHSMTNWRSRLVHKVAVAKGIDLSDEGAYAEYLASWEKDGPISPRHLLRLKRQEDKIALDEVESEATILSRFGSGAMSFGAISAESQRDVIRAMRMIGGRSNSGEGGENPFYFIDGTTASLKQIASGRFGVTAEYLVSADEFQIKVAQGAKPGEGGQLMGVKVTPEIARARHAHPKVDLISPPPLHDIYSIEDLKELIYELKAFKPDARVSVKLVSGANIGTIAVGVAKAGADVIHVAGHDGGTGAASLSSMKHAGIPWEIGLVEVHRALRANNLRRHVTLRVDGGLSTGKDIVIAALLGAEEFDFGKLLLVAQGCVMARVCEKNSCPTGIATHDPKFKAKYAGDAESIVTVLTHIAQDVRRRLGSLGLRSLDEAIGRGDLLEADPSFTSLLVERGIELQLLTEDLSYDPRERAPLVYHTISEVDEGLLRRCEEVIARGGYLAISSLVSTKDRAVTAPLSFQLASKKAQMRREYIDNGHGDTFTLPLTPKARFDLTLTGSAGQGFGVFLTEGITVRLIGEANDSVCKSMSGGKVIIRPHQESGYDPSLNSIIGNCALYGATGGTLFVSGLAGDRFAVRNSGAIAVVEGTGLHACEYMTNGTVVILGSVSHNVGAGMTGGVLFLSTEYRRYLNREYLIEEELTPEDEAYLLPLLKEYLGETGSRRAHEILSDPKVLGRYLMRCVPKSLSYTSSKIALTSSR